MLCKDSFKNTQKVKEFKTYRNKLTKIKTIAKKNYFEKRLQNCKKSSAEIQKVINEITNRQKKSYEFPHKLEINEDSLSDPVEIVNNLNLYFSKIGKQTCLNSISYQNFSINGPRSYYEIFSGLKFMKKKYLISSKV